MEDAIRRVIDADLAAQKQLKTIEVLQANNQKRIQSEKEEVFHTCWEQAKAYVAQAKQELDNEVQSANGVSEAQYVQQVEKLRKHFSDCEAAWKKELFQRCID